MNQQTLSAFMRPRTGSMRRWYRWVPIPARCSFPIAVTQGIEHGPGIDRDKPAQVPGSAGARSAASPGYLARSLRPFRGTPGLQLCTNAPQGVYLTPGRGDGDDSWEQPPPATYVVASDGHFVLDAIEIDYRQQRLAPEATVAAYSR